MLATLKTILAIDSPTGYTEQAANYVMEEYEKLGFAPVKTKKGGILVDLGGVDTANGVLLSAHLDTLGAMVAEVKSNGRLRLSPLGGLNPYNAEAENCRIITRSGKIYEGTLQLQNASIHVNASYNDTVRDFDTMEVVIDEATTSREETLGFGITVGDIVAFAPRTKITDSGYIKSRFLDDKLSVAILLGFAKEIKEKNNVPRRKIYHHITVYEEVGHGASATIPTGVTEIISVDMGCIGEGLGCSERQVSICAKDSNGPYNYDVVTNLVNAAKDNAIDYCVDIYPRYGSDANAALRAGYDIRHGLIGPGVYASHGYERSHVDGVQHTAALLRAYLL
jgi:putative aminopeptidase FrvX